MMLFKHKIARAIRSFVTQNDGSASAEVALLLPAFMFIFMMSFDAGRISLNHVMLERGVDLTVRQIQIGNMTDPTLENIKQEICDNARIIPDCTGSLQIEMIVMDMRNWDEDAIAGTARCIDRNQDVQPAVSFTNGGNNQLMVLRVCSLFDPELPGGALGRQMAENSGLGGYALSASAAFVMEPFQ